MKKLLLLFGTAIILSIILYAQAPQPILTRGGGTSATNFVNISANNGSFTNSLTLGGNSVLTGLNFSGPGVGGTVINPVFADSSNAVWQLDGSFTDVHLHLTNLPGSSGTPVNNFYATNFYATNIYASNIVATNITTTTINVTTNTYNVAKGGHLTITNDFTIQTNGALILNLSTPSVLVLGTNKIVTNATLSGLTLDNNNTLTASGGGSSSVFLNGISVSNPNLTDNSWITFTATSTTNISATPIASVTTLTYSGTNLTGFDCANKVFKIVLTQNSFIGTVVNLPTTSQYKEFVLAVQQDSTGGRFLNFTNSIFEWSEGVQPISTTNANAVDYYYFHTSIWTNSLLVGNMNPNIHL